MSTKCTIWISREDDHFYFDTAEVIGKDKKHHAITLEFSPENIRVDVNDKYEGLVFTLTDPESSVYKMFEALFNITRTM